jgi:hypothetical protein
MRDVLPTKIIKNVEQLPEEYADNMPIFYIISTAQTF